MFTLFSYIFCFNKYAHTQIPSPQNRRSLVAFFYISFHVNQSQSINVYVLSKQHKDCANLCHVVQVESHSNCWNVQCRDTRTIHHLHACEKKSQKNLLSNSKKGKSYDIIRLFITLASQYTLLKQFTYTWTIKWTLNGFMSEFLLQGLQLNDIFGPMLTSFKRSD